MSKQITLAMTPLLSISGLHAHYGKSHILHGVDMQVESATITALLGRNGSGRSTSLKAMAGLVRPTSGSIRFAEREIAGLEAFQIARAGLLYVPEERLIFPNLTVEENLVMGLQPARGGIRFTIDDVYAYFPRLAERRVQRGGTLSGGEQQMLTISRSLVGNPKLLLIDEPTEGLAPQIVETVVAVIRDIVARGVAVLLVEQKLTIALKVSRRLYVMGHGRIAFAGTPAEFNADSSVRKQWLEVA